MSRPALCMCCWLVVNTLTAGVLRSSVSVFLLLCWMITFQAKVTEPLFSCALSFLSSLSVYLSIPSCSHSYSLSLQLTLSTTCSLSRAQLTLSSPHPVSFSRSLSLCFTHIHSLELRCSCVMPECTSITWFMSNQRAAITFTFSPQRAAQARDTAPHHPKKEGQEALAFGSPLVSMITPSPGPPSVPMTTYK